MWVYIFYLTLHVTSKFYSFRLIGTIMFWTILVVHALDVKLSANSWLMENFQLVHDQTYLNLLFIIEIH